MKSLFIILLSSLFSISFVIAQEKLLRPNHLILLASIEKKKFRSSPTDISVTLLMSKSTMHSSVVIQVRCESFPMGLRDFSSKDIDNFINSGKMIKQKGKAEFQVTRGDTAITFKVEDAIALEEAMKEAHIGKTWYESLLTAKELPKKTPKSRPPQAPLLNISSISDKVSGNGIAYDIQAEVNLERENPRCRIVHGISYKLGSANSGNWHKLLDGISDGINAIEQNKDFKKDADSYSNYSLVADLKSKKIKVTYFVDKENNQIEIGYFGRKELDAINKAIEQAKVDGQWMIDHKSWFMK